MLCVTRLLTCNSCYLSSDEVAPYETCDLRSQTVTDDVSVVDVQVTSSRVQRVKELRSTLGHDVHILTALDVARWLCQDAPVHGDDVEFTLLKVRCKRKENN